MKRILFLSVLLAVFGLSTTNTFGQFDQSLVEAHEVVNDELRDSLDQFVASAKDELPNPFTFNFKGELMWVYWIEVGRGSGSCYAYFTISPPDVCLGRDTIIARVVFVEGAVPWTLDWQLHPNIELIAGNSNTPAIVFIANGEFELHCVVTDATGCELTNSQPITVNVHPTPAKAQLLAQHDLMAGGALLVFDADVELLTTDTIPIAFGELVIVSEPGDYLAKVNSPFGCDSWSTVHVDSFQVIEPEPCEPDTVYIDPCDGVHPPIGGFNVHSIDGNKVRFDSWAGWHTSVIWVFGDGDTSTVENPIHLYPGPGTYPVTQLVLNDCGDAVTTILIVVIPEESNDPPVAKFFAQDVVGCAPLTVQFLNQSQNADSYEWSFPGGTPSSSTQKNPVVVYNQPGVYSVSLTVVNAYGGDHKSVDGYVVVKDRPVADFEAIINELSVKLINKSTGATSYQWTFGDGDDSTLPDVTHHYQQSGTYEIFLVASNDCGSDVVYLEVTLECMGLNASVDKPEVCGGELFTLTGNVPGGEFIDYKWTPGTGGTIVGNNENAVVQAYLEESTWFYLEARHYFTGCVALDSVFVKLKCTTNTQDVQEGGGVLVSPNPVMAGGFLTLGLENLNLADVKVKMFNSRGNFACCGVNEKGDFLIPAETPAGMYLLSVEDLAQRRLYTSKVVVVR